MKLPTLLIITGQCRSGTSAAAQVVNRLGVPVATTLACPHVAADFQFDWEDLETLRVLLRWIPFGCRPSHEAGLGKALREVLAGRWASACGLADIAGNEQPTIIAAKSPLFALCYQDVLEAAHKMFDVRYVEMVRKQADIDASVEHTYWSAPMRRAVSVTNELIADALERIDDGFIDYDGLVEDPERGTKAIAEMIDVEWCVEAAQLIRQRV